MLVPVLASVVLAGCQSRAPRPDNRNGPQSTAQSSEVAVQSVSRQASTAARYQSVTFYLAQDQQAQGLSRLQIGKGVLWFSPQAVMNDADLENVQPRRSNNGHPFVRFQFTQAGAKKLAAITTKYRGNVLITTVGKNIISLLRLDMSAKQGILDIPMRTDQDAIDTANAISRQWNKS